MSGQPVVLGTGTATTGAAVVAALPNTGAARFVVIAGMVLVAFGVAMIAIQLGKLLARRTK